MIKTVLLDRYRVLDFIGEGGMQHVYRAQDLRLGREVALKTPKTPSAQRRFATSAQLSARMSHHNVAATLDYFEVGSSYYLVEELIPGLDLNRVLLERYFYFDPHLAAHILHGMSRGLTAAHHAGVFHRDLKPSNILYNESGGEVKLTDFGIAKMAEQELETALKSEESMSLSSTAVGAVPFMAPEMIRNSKTATIAADVWAIGCIGFFALTGEYPFGKGLAAVQGILGGQRVDVPTFALASDFRVLARDLLGVIDMCLRPVPEDRPTAEELARACGTLCYSTKPRRFGVIASFGSGLRNTGHIVADKSKLFFHRDSFYGAKNLLVDGRHVCFSDDHGEPLRRAFPVVPLR